jgi:hypothetical protein
MKASRAWSSYPITYRSQELLEISRWIATSRSGSVVGLPGVGKSNLLGFLCHRPDALETYLPSSEGRVILIPVDLNNLPANNLATLYRTILRSLHESGHRFESSLRESIHAQYLENRSQRDPFLSQSALRELLGVFQNNDIRLVLVLDRFDKFCTHATPHMTDTLRGLRDSFKSTLSYIVGMRQEVVYLPDPDALGELYELLDLNVCWVGALSDADCRQLITTVTRPASMPPSEQEVAQLLELGGGLAAILMSACQWWLTVGDLPAAQWGDELLKERGVRYRLEELWSALSQEEQQTLSELRSMNLRNVLREADAGRTNGGRTSRFSNSIERVSSTQQGLVSKGIAAWFGGEDTAKWWRISSSLFAAYVSEVASQSRGKLWIDTERKVIHQGRDPLNNLSPLENSLLQFLISNPRVRLTYSELIEATWPDDVQIEGVSTEALYQVVRGLRRKVETTISRPQYIVNWRGKPEGGYQCFPEGRPR